MAIPTSLLAPIAALALAAPARPPAACTGKISGPFTAAFTCLAGVERTADGKPVFEIAPKDALDDAPVYKPGAFELPGPPETRTYTLADLGMGMSSLAVEGGALYTATKTSGQRGEVTLTFRSVKRDPARPGAWTVHGTYRARLLPAGSGKTGEAIFEVSF